MAISSIGGSSYPDISSLTSTSNIPDAPTSTGTSPTEASTAGTVDNNSNLSLAIRQALAQLNANAGLSGLLTPDSQQATSDFMSNLYASLPGLSSSSASSTDPLSSLLGNSSSQPVAPVQLDQSSATIKLQTSIQNLISQLDGNSSTSNLPGISADSNSASGLPDLQQSFNSLLTASGGNPSQTTLQSFLKTVAANIQGSMSIGALFDASA